ncbi:MAG TPA: hypothetical protein VKA34_02040, partial [Balneolales bacterium]|nr:hypothetical protein [Balneolales bacterium]
VLSFCHRARFILRHITGNIQGHFVGPPHATNAGYSGTARLNFVPNIFRNRNLFGTGSGSSA